MQFETPFKCGQTNTAAGADVSHTGTARIYEPYIIASARKHGVDHPRALWSKPMPQRSRQPASGICPAPVSADVDLGVIITPEVVAASLLTGKLLTHKD